jgi:hypothetical protein
MNKSIIAIALLIIVGIVWYLFRPERLIIDAKVNEDFPAAEDTRTNKEAAKPLVLYSGKFHEVAHPAKGIATVYKLPDGKHILRFTEFEVSNGPDVVVYLSAVDDANDNDSVKNSKFISLGSIKGNIGDQNYELPGDLDLNIYRSVVIWCKRFGVNFAVAPLKSS